MLKAWAEAGQDGLVQGAGRSYGDVPLADSGRLLKLDALDHVLAVDWRTGRIRAQSGLTLDGLLRLCVPRGWFPPVVPGTRRITLGGAVANDVHGKNHHHRGTFGRHVTALGLVRSDRGRLTCSPQVHPALFGATVGGLGLSGVIEWVELQLVPIGSRDVAGVTQRFANLDALWELTEALDARHEFSVAWVDCTQQGQQLGRGIYTAGNFCADGPGDLPDDRARAFPVTPPFSLVNEWTLRAFNQAYWHRAPSRPVAFRQGLLPFFFPLDGIEHWNRMYGVQGFQQYQAVLPLAVSASGLSALLGAVARSGLGSFLAVVKRCGSARSPGWLSFPMEGFSLALDFAQQARPAERLFPELDAIVRDHGGRLYPAKDAHMRGEDFRAAYPAWERLEALRDPALMSRFWRRVTT